MTVPALNPPDVVCVLGAGNMGSGIAQACAQAGYTVRVRDVTEAMLARGRGLIEKTLDGAIARKKSTPEKKAQVLGRITFTTELRAAVEGASLLIEAVFEEEAVKRTLFAEIAPWLGPDTIVATNTSSLSVTQLAASVPSPGRFAGLHFFYPAAINKLLEVIGGGSTDAAVLDRLEAFGYRLRKIPIRVRDRAGFAVNRFFVPYLNEAARMADEGVASLATIEEVGRRTFGTTLGPFELMNVTGIPIAYHSMGSLFAAFGPAYAPSPLLERQFRAGSPWPWRSTTVEPEREEAVRRRFLGLVFGIATELVEEGVATPEATDRGATVGLRWAIGPFALMNRTGLGEAHRLVEEYASRWKGAFPVAAGLTEKARRGEATWPLPQVRVERQGAVAWVLLDRPEVLNSLSTELFDQLERTFLELRAAPGLRAVVLAGSSPVFAAGADIAEMEKKDLAEGRAFGYRGQAACHAIETFPHPVIALVEGYALGGGLELALACDFIVAADDAKLGLPEATVGIHPGMGGASRLTRLIGPARTKYVVFTGHPLPAAEALRLGFVALLVPAASARSEVAALAETIASRAPLALSGIKQVIDLAGDAPLAAALRLEGESAGYTFSTKDQDEGMRAFLERRPPRFTGE
jgi:enoyl-CoA hydratase/3-hydroxyacyl-CoA dehydrogenase